MKWINRNDSESQYEDRRGKGMKRGAIGGIGGLIVVIIALLLGQNPLSLGAFRKQTLRFSFFVENDWQPL
ncbi:MAG: hypothetical protein PHI32_08360 [Dysgonamonadaceae bacterium]|nr:hypothetical protein [Dysgonamonadaceae bacterium]MDD4727867.1 hypothetical protein [Dysgonamonadaceae bacterium]